MIYFNILLILVTLYVYHKIEHPFWCAAVFSIAKLLSFFAVGGYTWQNCIFSGIIVYLLATLYFWLLSITQNKLFLYWTILIIGFFLFMF